MWYVHYKTGGAAGMLMASTLPLAIKNACELLDQNADVFQIEDKAGLRALNAAEIRRACAERKARKALH